MELVTEPNTFENTENTAKSVSAFTKEFQLILWYLEVSEANMEKGEMRVEVNISVSEEKNKLGTKVEVKNLNSFRSVERAIKFELDRMIELLENGKGDEIVQETRGWDENKQQTFSQRKKEFSQDYRYFPEPDLPKMKLYEAFNLNDLKKSLPELPEVKRLRYKNDFGIKGEDIEMYINDPDLASWFEEVVKSLMDKSTNTNKERIKMASNFITSDYLGIKKTNLAVKPPSAKNLAELVRMFTEDKISSRVAKDILAVIVTSDESPLKIATEKNLLQENNEDALREIIERVIKENSKVVVTYKAGKENAIMSLVGKVIKKSNGSANPKIVIEMLKKLLG